MANKQFETTNSMQKTKLMNQFYIYYIDVFHTKYNDIDITHRYVADRRIIIDDFTRIVENSEDYVIFEFNYDDTPRQLKGFKTKEAAQRTLP